MAYSYVIAGSGLSGSVYARQMAEKGHKVLVLERRNHIGGNVYDEKDSNGILIHKYGPHIFHTNSDEVYQFITRFAEWEPFKLKCEVEMLGKSTPSPFNYKTIDQFYSVEKAALLKNTLKAKYPDRVTVTIVELLNDDNELIREYANFLFENDYSLYTAKQWGIKPSEIDISVLKRVPVRLDYESMYFTDKYECMPKQGYTSFVEKLLNHENIDVELGVDALKKITLSNGQIQYGALDVTEDCKFVYTGPIDRLFGYCYGELPYRSLRFEYKSEEKDSFQNAPVVAYPQVPDFTRITEYKKLPVQNVKGKTSYAVEYPLSYKAGSESEPYYPIPTEQTAGLYAKYKELSQKYEGLMLCGRLAEYKYYNMDQAILSVLNNTKTL